MEKPFEKGARVRIHPASDWFMRGEKFGTVTSLRRNAVGQWVVYLRGERSGKRIRLHESLCEVA